MKLYYAPGACSLASHIVLREIGADFDLEQVDTKTQKTASGADFAKINPKGYVPALAIDGGEVLTEGAALLQYLADSKPEAGLAPPAGTIERTHLQAHLNFVASEVHKAFSPFFAPAPPEGAAREAAEAKVVRRLDYVDSLLSDGRPYLMGDDFTVADSYLFVIAGWAVPTGIGLDRWPHLAAYIGRIAARPQVAAAMQAEGLAN